jgi:3-hydroxybutyryl-CoA dehydrogenase
MGLTITTALLRAGADVQVCSRKQPAAVKGMVLRRMEKLAAPGSSATDPRAVPDPRRLAVSSSLEDLRACGLVVEAVAEDLALKKAIFLQLDSVCPPETILATNTSSLSVQDLAQASRRPSSFLGLHFFNPADHMNLVEVVRTTQVTPGVVERMCALLRAWGFWPVVVPDIPGFIVNRILFLQILEAVRLLAAGVAAPQVIDDAMVKGANQPVGPLALADTIGLDVVLEVSRSLFERTGVAAYEPPILLQRFVEQGKLGRKSKEGFYRY